MAVQSPDQIRLWFQLNQLEKGVIKAIRESDAPFLGLLGESLTGETRGTINKPRLSISHSAAHE